MGQVQDVRQASVQIKTTNQIISMQKTIFLLNQGFESSSEKTPEFKAFTRVFKTEFQKVLSRLGCSQLKFSIGHFYVSGFFNSSNGTIWYFSLSDVRSMNRMYQDQQKLLIRTARDRKDYVGGPNQWASLADLQQELERIVK